MIHFEGNCFLRAEAEYFAERKARGYPVRVYQTLGEPCDPFCVVPVAHGGALDGCFASGKTLNEAIDRLDAILPSIIKFWRREIGYVPKPAPAPSLTI